MLATKLHATNCNQVVTKVLHDCLLQFTCCIMDGGLYLVINWGRAKSCILCVMYFIQAEDATIVLSVVLPVVVVLIIIIVIAVGVALYFRARRDHAMA